ncbi:hypothetical protein COW80_02045 [Candidatus Beckwithbacteria bacterium CG22_combo_CG10-13_8_21_14_all_01_47_9]|uniref:Transposase IS200-like domain-containing protein n=1 Tax=Candidatus Beckwithbacteria bacterium CG22_combo_CG10-13_8_21_14_all_01_47_9 TaxID=1974496 RepID=A0A2H0E124_9BACT|nr:MAG: hypothetical protein COW80_02045 [Candidatus Beckwithbacteria bacterium CG22_combo_CG10-13_8_21_14_all_01_47_9]
MPSIYLRRNFKPNTFHHLCNRGGFQHKIFRKKKDYEVFTDILKYYLHHPEYPSLSKLSEPKIKKIKKSPQPYRLLAYCLMPNHFHLLMQQCEDSPTLSAFMKKISVTYAMYFQYQYHHSGGLFQGKFRSVQFYRDDSLLYVSKYIHLNPRGMEGSDPSIYLWSSLSDYLNSSNKNWLHPEVIFNTFFAKSGDPRREYKQYIFTPADAEKEILLRKMEGSDPSI